MLKFLVVVLLLVNAFLFALYRGYLEPIWPSGREPQRLQQQITPEKIRLLGSVAAVAVPVPAPTPVPKAVAAPSTASCIELGNFNEAEATRFEAQISALSLNERLSRRTVTDAASYMVFIPPLADKESADRKGAELRRLDVKDFFVMQSGGDMRFAISLGIFKTRAAADQHLAELVNKGVRSARVGGRGAGGDKIAFQLRDLNEDGLARAVKLADTFDKIDQRECAARAR